MISVHNKTETIFTGSGLGVVDNEIIDPVVSEELAGLYMLEFTYPTNAPLAKHLIPENLIAAPVPSSTIRQGFRITSVTTSLTGMLQISALHVSYDLAHNLVVDTFVVNQTPTAALTQILGASQYPHSFTATSADTATRASVRIVRTAVLAAIMDEGADNSFTSRWGGEISRDNFHLHHAPRLGADRGVVIRDAKNLTGYSSHLDYTTITTRVLPVGFDGLLLPEKYVDSPRINDYKYPYVQVIKFEDIKAIKDSTQPGEGELPLSQAHDALRNAAKTYLAAGNDLPTCSYQVRFVELSQTRQYAKFQQLEKVVLGDTVTVIHDGLGVSLKARVVAYTFNPATHSYLEVTLGQVGAKFSAITKTITQAKNSADNAVALAGAALASADGKTTNHYANTQPVTARLGDTWFKPNGETIEIWVYTTTSSGQPGWVSAATDLNHAQISAELEDARGQVQAASLKAEQAKTAADGLSAALASAQVEIDQAKTVAVSAEHKAIQVEAATTVLDARLVAASSELDQAKQATAQVVADLVALSEQTTSLDAGITNLNTRISGVETQAQQAHNLVVQAQTDASKALSDAAVAAGIAAGKADVLIQANEPDASMRKPSTLWIDTTSQANAPKRWNVTTWVAITDKTALTAAANALTAVNAASAARARADAAYNLADTKPSSAQVQTMITTSANGKNQIILATSSPSGAGGRVGDTWWRHVDSKIIGQWTWDGSKWLPTTLTHAVITSVDVNTLQVTSAARMNQVVVDKIIGDAAHFRLLAANKLLIGSTANLIPDGDLTVQPTLWDQRLTKATSQPPAGCKTYLTSTPGLGMIDNAAGGVFFPVTPGGKYAFEVWLKADLPDSLIYIELRNQNGTLAGTAGPIINVGDQPTGGSNYLINARTVPTEWTRFSCVFTMRLDSEQVRLARIYFNHSNGAQTGATVSVGGIRLRAMTGRVLIEDGAITADKISANAITAIKIQAGAVTSDKLTIANGFITTAMIKDATITDAKIASLDAAKINTGVLAASRIAAGSITSDKLTIANGFITTAMIKDATITDAKIASLDAAKINTGVLAASRIAAGSITSDKLTVANGFITTAMIKDATITSAKIAALDAGKITTGYLSAARIQAGSITADKFAANAIQVGLAGWTSTIRISPSNIAWYNGTTLEGNLDAGGMTYWWGNRKIGQTIRVAKAGNENVQGLVNQLAFTGDYIAWTWVPTATSGTSMTCLTLDPKGTFHGTPGIHLGTSLRTGGHKFFTTDDRFVTLKDCVLTGNGAHPGWVGPTSLSQVVFHTYDLMITSNGRFYNMSRVMDRLTDLMGRVNEIIRRLNYGWIVSITGSGSNISWSNFPNSGLQAMQTTTS